MALIKCPECGKEISDKAVSCPNCGYPINRMEDLSINPAKGKNEDEISLYIIEILNKYSKKEKIKMAKELIDKLDIKIETAVEIVNRYVDNGEIASWLIQKDVESETETDRFEEKEFHGIYRYGFFGGKTKVYCPRCHSENCSYYQEQKIIPGKTKTRYTANLNPLRPFTLVNKKEKVIRKEEFVTESKIVCNDCGYIFS